jgi:hypothetical protein
LTVSQPPGRIQSILSSSGPITIISSGKAGESDHSAALRLAHVFQLFHRLDSEIIAEDEARTRTAGETWLDGNIVFIGPPVSPFVKEILGQERTPVRTVDSTIHLGTRKFQKLGQGPFVLHQDSLNFSNMIMVHNVLQPSCFHTLTQLGSIL